MKPPAVVPAHATIAAVSAVGLPDATAAAVAIVAAAIYETTR